MTIQVLTRFNTVQTLWKSTVLSVKQDGSSEKIGSEFPEIKIRHAKLWRFCPSDSWKPISTFFL